MSQRRINHPFSRYGLALFCVAGAVAPSIAHAQPYAFDTTESTFDTTYANTTISLTGTVTTRTGTAIANASISVAAWGAGAANATKTATTNASGGVHDHGPLAPLRAAQGDRRRLLHRDRPRRSPAPHDRAFDDHRHDQAPEQAGRPRPRDLRRRLDVRPQVRRCRRGRHRRRSGRSHPPRVARGRRAGALDVHARRHVGLRLLGREPRVAHHGKPGHAAPVQGLHVLLVPRDARRAHVRGHRRRRSREQPHVRLHDRRHQRHDDERVGRRPRLGGHRHERERGGRDHDLQDAEQRPALAARLQRDGLGRLYGSELPARRA